MARYNREILVPYLQDICSLYLADRKLKQMIRHAETKAAVYRREVCLQKPDYPTYENTEIGCIGHVAIVWCVLYLILFVISLFSGVPFSLKAVLFIGAIIGAIVWAASVENANSLEAANKRKREKYEKDMADYTRNLKAANDERNSNLLKASEIQNTVSEIRKECRKIQDLLNLAYSANIIPRHYRNIYAAVFLYDWFSTSGADDLDMALNMFVLEEIKAKLDRIIEQQADMILNQRIMIANQDRISLNQENAMQMQKEQNQMMQNKLNRIQATEEERLRYEKMAESNTAATAYFAWANYLK